MKNLGGVIIGAALVAIVFLVVQSLYNHYAPASWR